MRAENTSAVGAEPIWTVYSSANNYMVFRGKYTLHRAFNGKQAMVSIMHPRFSGLRARIDAAIEAAKKS